MLEPRLRVLFLCTGNAARSQIAEALLRMLARKEPLAVTDSVLRMRRSHEAVHLREVAAHARRTVLEPGRADVLVPAAVAA